MATNPAQPQTGTPVPATALSAFQNPDFASQLTIGSNEVNLPNPNLDAVMWLVVVDLTNLSIVFNDINDFSTVPSGIQPYIGNSRYFLFAISSNAWAANYPQGDLYAFFQKVGAGPQLARGEQIFEQLETGWISNYTYILAATMSEADLPGFELFSATDHSILTMAFLPVTVDGQTIYAPIQQGVSASASVAR